MTTSANTRPAAWRMRSRRSCTGGRESDDRLPRRLLRVRGDAVHEHVDVAPHQPHGRDEDERGDEERCDRVGARVARAHEQQADEHGDRAAEVAARSAARSTRAQRSSTRGPRAPTPRPRRRRCRSRRRSRANAYHVACTADAAVRRAARSRARRSGGWRGRGSRPRRAPRGARPCRGRTGGRGRPGARRRRPRRTSAARRSGRCRSAPPPRGGRGCAVARPVPSLSPIRASAATTEKSAVRRCGVTPEA